MKENEEMEPDSGYPTPRDDEVERRPLTSTPLLPPRQGRLLRFSDAGMSPVPSSSSPPPGLELDEFATVNNVIEAFRRTRELKKENKQLRENSFPPKEIDERDTTISHLRLEVEELKATTKNEFSITAEIDLRKDVKDCEVLCDLLSFTRCEEERRRMEEAEQRVTEGQMELRRTKKELEEQKKVVEGEKKLWEANSQQMGKEHQRREADLVEKIAELEHEAEMKKESEQRMQQHIQVLERNKEELEIRLCDLNSRTKEILARKDTEVNVKLRMKQEEMDDLREKKRTVAEELACATSALEEWRRKAEETEGWKVRAEKAETQRKKAEKKEKDMEDQSKKTLKAYQQLEEELKRKEEEEKIMPATIRDLEMVVQQEREQIQRILEEKEEIAEKMQELERECESLVRDTVEEKQKLVEIKMQKGEWEKERQALQRKVVHAEGRAEKAEEEVVRERKEAQKVKPLQDEVEALRQHRTQQEEELQVVREQAVAAKERVKAMEESLASLERRGEKENEMKDVRRRNEEVEEELAKQMKAMDELHLQYENLMEDHRQMLILKDQWQTQGREKDELMTAMQTRLSHLESYPGQLVSVDMSPGASLFQLLTPHIQTVLLALQHSDPATQEGIRQAQGLRPAHSMTGLAHSITGHAHPMEGSTGSVGIANSATQTVPCGVDEYCKMLLSMEEGSSEDDCLTSFLKTIHETFSANGEEDHEVMRRRLREEFYAIRLRLQEGRDAEEKWRETREQLAETQRRARRDAQKAQATVKDDHQKLQKKEEDLEFLRQALLKSRQDCKRFEEVATDLKTELDYEMNASQSEQEEIIRKFDHMRNQLEKKDEELEKALKEKAESESNVASLTSQVHDLEKACEVAANEIKVEKQKKHACQEAVRTEHSAYDELWKLFENEKIKVAKQKEKLNEALTKMRGLKHVAFEQELKKIISDAAHIGNHEKDYDDADRINNRVIRMRDEEDKENSE